MTRNGIIVFVIAGLVFGLMASGCDESWSAGTQQCGRGMEGDSCQSAADCDCGLRCINLACVSGEPIADGDTVDIPEAFESDNTDPDTIDDDPENADGDADDSDAVDTDADLDSVEYDGEPMESEADLDSDSETMETADAELENPDGDAGESIESDEPEAADNEAMEYDADVDMDAETVSETETETDGICDPRASYQCYDGDVYWYDCNGVRQVKKEDCDSCECSENACVVDNEYAARCDESDVYWYDCHGVRQEIKEECDSCECSESACVQDVEHDAQCYDNDVYWYDCHGVRQEKKEECAEYGCDDTCGECNDGYPLLCEDGVCTDPETHFQWEQIPTGGTSWGDAKEHCQNLDLNGGGWRLPNISELRTLVRGCHSIEMSGACGVKDECSECGVSSDDICLQSSCETEACDPYLECTTHQGPGELGCYMPKELEGSCWHWSSSSVADNIFNAWNLRFMDSKVTNDDKNRGVINARCVR